MAQYDPNNPNHDRYDSSTWTTPSYHQGGSMYTESNRNPWTGGIHNTNQANAAQYDAYVMNNPDLMQDYQNNWASSGMSMTDYGSMHYYGKGKKDGRELPGASSNNQSAGPAPRPPSGGGGGGGGSSGAAAAAKAQDNMIKEMQRQEAEAKAAEEARKAEIEKNNASINAMFDEREGDYTQYADDLFEHNRQSYDESANDARRQTKFATARTGNVGGSVDADTQGSLERMYQDGLTNLRSGSQDAANSVRAQDNQQRNALLQQSATGSYNPNLKSSQPTFADTSMTNMSAGVGNQFQSLLGGIGGASKQNNPWGYGY